MGVKRTFSCSMIEKRKGTVIGFLFSSQIELFDGCLAFRAFGNRVDSVSSVPRHLCSLLGKDKNRDEWVTRIMVDQVGKERILVSP